MLLYCVLFFIIGDAKYCVSTFVFRGCSIIILCLFFIIGDAIYCVSTFVCLREIIGSFFIFDFLGREVLDNFGDLDNLENLADLEFLDNCYFGYLVYLV